MSKKSLANITKDAQKKYGAGIVGWACEYNKTDVLPTGILSLDRILPYGGLPKGRIIEISGAEGAGKCLVKDTYCLTENGLETIEEIVTPKYLKLFKKDTYYNTCVYLTNENNLFEAATHFYNNGVSETIKITTENGQEIQGTLNHPIRTISNGKIIWKKLENFSVGDYVAVKRNTQKFGKQHNKILGKLLGYLIADGCLNYKCRISFTNSNSKILNNFLDLIVYYNPKSIKKYKRGKVTEIHINDKKLRTNFYETYGLKYIKAKDKEVPLIIRRGSKETQKEFLKVYIDLESHVNSKEIEISSASKKLLLQVQLMLLNFGIVSIFKEKKIKQYPNNIYYRLFIRGKELQNYTQKIGFVTKKISNKTKHNTNIDSIPSLGSLLDKLHKNCTNPTRKTNKIINNYKNNKVNVTYERLNIIITHFLKKELTHKGKDILQQLKNIREKKYFFTKVKTIEKSNKNTYDFVLPETHSFITNGFISHNTTLSYQIISQIQKQKGIAVLYDTERRFDPEYAGACGVNVSDKVLPIIHPEHAEQGLQICEDYIRSGTTDLIVIDSVAGLVPQEEMEKEMDKQQRGLQARVLGKALRKMLTPLAESGCFIIFVNQIRMKMTMFGNPETTPGGRALKFFSSVRLDVRRKQVLKDSKTKEPVGIETKVKIKKAQGGEGRVCFYNSYFGEGIDLEQNLQTNAIKLDIIERKGSTYKYGDKSWRGKKNVKKALKNDLKLYNEIYKKTMKELKGG